jgi:hypothetical protein
MPIIVHCDKFCFLFRVLKTVGKKITNFGFTRGTVDNNFHQHAIMVKALTLLIETESHINFAESQSNCKFCPTAHCMLYWVLVKF